MKNAIQRNNLALTLKTPRKQLFPRGRVLLSSVVALVVSLAWLPAARAQCREGCSPEGYDAFLGNDALASSAETGSVAIGDHALAQATGGAFNIGIGQNALLVAFGYDNVAVGSATLWSLTSGSENTACGTLALSSNTTGYGNTAVGSSGMLGDQVTFKSTGSYNTAICYNALARYTYDNCNTSRGYESFFNYTTDE